MKYRIKVFPHKGRMWHMPQRKFLFWWKDMVCVPSNGRFDSSCYAVMSTEQSCLAFIEYWDTKRKGELSEVAEAEEFEREHPVKYIQVCL